MSGGRQLRTDDALWARRRVKARLASRLLTWAVERYRREKQAPLLRGAGELFATLTLGGFVRLDVDDEDGKLRTRGVRANGKSVGVEGMSTGVRDQLYLAYPASDRRR